MRKLRTIEMKRLSVEEYHEAEKTPLIVILDDVRSMHNVGSVFRTADAFRLEAVYLCGITGCPPHAEIHKTALGAEDSVAWRYFGDTMEALSWLRDEGYTLLAIEQCEGSTMLTDFVPDENKKYAVILGNEVKGVQQQVVDVVRLQFAQTLIDGGSGLGLAVVAYPYFGHQENILTRYTGFRDGGTHAFFVVIGLGGVNKAITDGKGIGHAALRFLRRDLEYAVAEKGHLNAVGKGCVLHGW